MNPRPLGYEPSVLPDCIHPALILDVYWQMTSWLRPSLRSHQWNLLDLNQRPLGLQPSALPTELILNFEFGRYMLGRTCSLQASNQITIIARSAIKVNKYFTDIVKQYQNKMRKCFQQVLICITICVTI